MTWKSKRERTVCYKRIFEGQIFNLHRAYKTLIEYMDYADMDMCEIDTCRPAKTPTFDQIQAIDFHGRYVCKISVTFLPCFKQHKYLNTILLNTFLCLSYLIIFGKIMNTN